MRINEDWRQRGNSKCEGNLETGIAVEQGD